MSASEIKGFSVRKARKAVNGFFDVLAKQLRQGRSVKVPGGTLQVIPQNRTRRQTLQRLTNIRTGRTEQRLIAYGQRRRVIKFKPTLKLDFLPPRRVKPPTPEQIEMLQLAGELLGEPIGYQDLISLYSLVNRLPKPTETLLLRLRELMQRGNSFKGAGITRFLAAVFDLHWIWASRG